jgi:hypothetical protein
MIMRSTILFVLVFAFTGCATLPVARIALSPSLQAGTHAEKLVGICGASHGRFEAGDFAGTFQRSDTRLAIFDQIFEQRGGYSRFSLWGPGISDTLEADCRTREQTVSLSIMSFERRPMAYSCIFSHGGRPVTGSLELHAHREGVSGMLMKEARRGEIALDDVVLQIRSIHRAQGSPVRLAMPIGYEFVRDGVAVGAIEINGASTLFYAAGSDLMTRRVVLVAGIALGLLWDPAQSPLGREAN